mmetsp:Transcript_25635/g.28318  ORF Transcript_25635/g.28318 Transcript_25635/m.28318 type:complete len:91 (+) Transcript_25635:47-319(+)
MNFRITTTFVLLLASLQITVGSLLRPKEDSDAKVHSGDINSKVQNLEKKINEYREKFDLSALDPVEQEKLHDAEIKLDDLKDRLSMRAEL